MQIEAFLRLAESAVAIRDSDASWETKYDLVFSSEISQAISETGVQVSYVDPDGSYEEDVRAFVDVVEEKANDIKKSFERSQWALECLLDDADAAELEDFDRCADAIFD